MRGEGSGHGWRKKNVFAHQAKDILSRISQEKSPRNFYPKNLKFVKKLQNGGRVAQSLM